LVVWRLDQRADVKVECSHFKRFKTTITLPPLEPDELVNRISSPKIEKYQPSHCGRGPLTCLPKLDGSWGHGEGNEITGDADGEKQPSGQIGRTQRPGKPTIHREANASEREGCRRQAVRTDRSPARHVTA
jgi:hypothetical protein